MWRLFCPVALLLVLFLASHSVQPVRAAPHELVIATGNPTHFNPLLLTGQVVGSIGAQLFAGLTRLDGEGNAVPYLASSWTESEDRLSFRFRLREHAVFHDGTPITSEDVAFSILAGKRYHPFHPMLEAVEAVETPDPLTVQILLNRPFPILPVVLLPSLVPILPKHVYGDGTPLPVHPANRTPVGSGPFMLETLVPNQELRLKRNPRFFLPEKPLLERVTFRFFWDQSEVLYAMNSGSVDIYPFASPLFLKHYVEASATIRTRAVPLLNPHLLIEYNLLSKPFSDRKVREAIALAVDIRKLARNVDNRILPQYGPLPPDSPYFSPVPFRQDVELANRLLDEAGYPRGPEGTRFALPIDYIPGADFFPAVLQVLRSDLERVGIDVQIRAPSHFREWAQRVTSGHYQATLEGLFAWHDPVVGIHRLYVPNQSDRKAIWSNRTGYENPEVTSLLREASSTKDPGRRQALYGRFQKRVAEDYPALWLGAMPYLLVHSSDVLHLETTPLGILSPLDAVDKR